MKLVHIDFKNFKNLKVSNPYELQLPENWQELSEWQAKAIMPYWFNNQEASSLEKSNIVACLLPRELHSYLYVKQIMALTPLVSWLWKSPHTSDCLKSFDIDGKSYYLPADQFANVTFDEWMEAYTYQIYYQLTKDQQFLNNFIACYCRPLKADFDSSNPIHADDYRESYSSNLMKLHADSITTMDYNTKLYVLSFLTANINAIKKSPNYGRVFPKPIESERKKQNVTQKDALKWWDWGLIWSQNLGLNFETEFVKMNIHNIFRLVQNYLKHHQAPTK